MTTKLTAIPAAPDPSAPHPPDASLANCSTHPPLHPRDRFLQACACQPLDHPPVWLMRQAGRALPEYRELKARHSFVELVQNPELAVEVTLQPLRRFDFDAAVLFSDILVVPEAMGQPYQFLNGGGVAMQFSIRSQRDLDRLDASAIHERLAYVAQALNQLRSVLHPRTALLGFAGSPWTLANFMIEGGSSSSFTLARELFYTAPDLFEKLMTKLTAAVADHLRMQIEAGADAVQIFDSLAGLLAASDYEAASASWMSQIIATLPPNVPVIIYARGIHGPWHSLVQTGARALSVDWSVPLPDVHDQLPPGTAVQGNLDPILMTTRPDIVTRETRRLLESMRGRNGHIFNLGHGLPPAARLENIEALVQTVRSFK